MLKILFFNSLNNLLKVFGILKHEADIIISYQGCHNLICGEIKMNKTSKQIINMILTTNHKNDNIYI